MVSGKGKAKVTPGTGGVEVNGLNSDGQLPLFFPALVIEGMSTSDGRNIGAGALGHRALPISILAQWQNPGQQGGHAGAEVIGHLTELTRVPGPEVVSRQTGAPFPEGTFVWQGRGVADPDTTGGKLVQAGHLRGNSVDLADVDYDESFADDGKATINITRGEIAATTLCPIPAFADAYVEVVADEEPVTAADLVNTDMLAELDSVLVAAGYGPDAARRAVQSFMDLVAHPLPPWRSAELGDTCGECSAQIDGDEWTETQNADGTITFSPTVAKRRRAYARGLAIKGEKSDGSDASYPIENQSDLDKAAGMVGLGSDSNGKIRAHIKKAARKLGLKLPPSLQASGTPALPPLALFSDPGLTAYTPVRVGDPRPDGRREIVGHIGQWNDCHVGYTNTCVRMPHSRVDYARFATGAARCVDETGQTRLAAVGPLSMSRNLSSGGHAPSTLNEADAVAFYDNHCTAVADVAVGEDEHGVWMHGLTRPDVTEADVDRILATPPSGDWRGYRGNLELCAILLVPRPGYVVPRARVASGELVSLVAAGIPVGQLAGDGISEQAIVTAVNKALIAFFDPDNDGDIDRPIDPTLEQGDDAGPGDPPNKPDMAARHQAALLAIRRGDALAALDAGPFDPAR
jgi:hypothetical protein